MFFKTDKKSKQIKHQGVAGEVVYAIGDVHGCLALLKDLLNKIDRHAERHAPQGYTLVFLGDLIDRGPQSAQVIDYVKHYKPNGVKCVYIKGNHEEVLIKVVGGSISSLISWMKFGGRECLQSYGVANLGEIETNPEGLMHRVQSTIPKNHIAFLESFEDYYQWGDYLFVHAGIVPKKTLDKQSPKDMRWIREPFLSYKKPHPFKIVHGHTVVKTAEDFGNRVAVDTGAHNGGALTAVFLKGETLDFIRSIADESLT